MSIYGSSISPQTKCIYFIAPDNLLQLTSPLQEITIQNQTRKIRTLLNFFAGNSPINLGPAAIFTTGKKTKFIKAVEPEINAFDFRVKDNTKYSLKPNITRELINSTYKIIDEVCERIKPNITLDRYNLSLSRENVDDKIIDITISLESLISGKDELRFRFALYLSHIVKTEPDERVQAFSAFKDLYDARSGIVHGSSDSSNKRARDRVLSNWEQVKLHGRIAINYYLFYRHFNKEKPWDDHLRDLVFGIDRRIIE